MTESDTTSSPPAPAPPPSPRPRRGPRVRFLLSLAFVAAVALALGAFLSDRIWRGGDHQAGVIAQEGGDHVHGAASSGGYFTCGMHPWVILPTQGLCPICHMELTPLDPAKLTGEIAINPVIVQNIGVRVAPVIEGPLTKEIRTVGNVSFDETRLRVIATKVGGWVEDLLVDSEGDTVEPGQPLFSIYSPELYAVQEELVLAAANRQAAPELLEAARTRLRYFDIGEDQIAEIERSGKPTRTLGIRSAHRGVVVEKLINEGSRIEAGTPAYRVADLSRVWVNVTLYEYQLPYVQVGQAAAMTLPFLPGRQFEGTVAYIYPYLNEQTRQLRVRLEFANDDGALKPGMFANVELRSTLEETATLAPREAIIRTGSREVAFVSLGDGRFEPRNVRAGVDTSEGLVAILEGLEPGEQVVTSGQFLLDSESKMRTALAKMVEGDLAAAAPAATPAATGATAMVTPEVQAALDRIARTYLAVQVQLAADQLGQFPQQMAELHDAAGVLVRDERFTAAAEAIAQAGAMPAANLAEARQVFKSLSEAVIPLLRDAPPTSDVAPQLIHAHCPMAKADWLQATRELVNPYMGPRMLKCGTTEGVIASAPSPEHAGHSH